MSELCLVIGNKNYSSWSLRPWIFMKQAGIAFAEKRIALSTDSTDRELAPYFSAHKVPVLIDEDLTVWDSLAILEYVSEKSPAHPGWPQDSAARAVARSVSAEMHSSFSALRGELPMNCRRKPGAISLSSIALQEIERVKALWRHCRSHYGKGRPWLFGSFSIADAMYAPVASRFEVYAVPLAGIEAEYVQALLRHPAFLEWKEAARSEAETIEIEEL